MDDTNWNPTSMQPIPMEQLSDIYKRIIRELIATFDLDDETVDAEPLPTPIG
jgi:GMP synthase PP-ATPase subunit